MKVRNILLTISYDGSSYQGWQRQKPKTGVGIQNVLEKVLSGIFREPVLVNGTGRTDAGAHALCYPVNFQTSDFKIAIGKLPYILNRFLPPDIRVISAVEEAPDFHGRYSINAREYIYFTVNSNSILPQFNNYCYSDGRKFDFERLKKAMRLFCGEHSFQRFCGGYHGKEKNYIRTVYYFRVKEIRILSERVFIFFIKGNGFLQGMIRTLVAASLNCAAGDISLEDIKNSLELRNFLPNRYRKPVPAKGLYFKRGYKGV